jgi:sec-independent protein translocase protein TatA
MIGTTELILIALVVLLLFGSKKIPELARSMGNFVNEFNKAKDSVTKDTAEKDKKSENK